MGCDEVGCNDGISLYRVSIHAPAWGATKKSLNIPGHGLFQSTHPHGVRQDPCVLHNLLFFVSIHAPAWGATNTIIMDNLDGAVSIHAPAWGATSSSLLTGVSVMFQSTHPHGVRRCCSEMGKWQGCFNPRTRMGCDNMGSALQNILPCFNPRTRMGCDLIVFYNFTAEKVSIHAPAWGATKTVLEAEDFPKVSIHAPAWGATLISSVTCFHSQVSIHAPAWGATLLQVKRLPMVLVSIHAPAWGATAYTNKLILLMV